MKPRSELNLSTKQEADLNKYLTLIRLASYSQLTPPVPVTPVFSTFDLYVYNMALAGSFLGPIHLLEVVTRNAMHEQLSNFAGQDDWWDSTKINLTWKHKKMIDETKERLTKEHSDQASRKLANGTGTGIPVPVTSNDVMGGVEFGVWCNLLGTGTRENPTLDYERKLWQPILRFAFPGFRGDRKRLATKMNAARSLRNRVSHHGPIHERDHQRDYEDIRIVLNSISPGIATWMDDRSRLISEVVNCKPGTPLQACYF
jgi:hypothetical protein